MPMRKVLIVGAGQAGLQLAHGLLDHGYDVTLITAVSSDELRYGNVSTAQAMFDTALQRERDQKLNFWEDEAPNNARIGVKVHGEDHTPVIRWAGTSDGYSQAVDRRVKMSGWLEHLEERGGRVVVHGATVTDLEGFARMFDLVVVAVGQGDLAEVFDRDPARSFYRSPRLVCAAVYVHGFVREDGPTTTWCDLNPGDGQLVLMPAYTTSGPCDVLFLQADPGGAFDRFDDRPDTAEQHRRTLDIAREFFPQDFERCKDTEPTDAGAGSVEKYEPIIRKPVGVLPSGRLVLGMADVVVRSEPITSQAWNNSSFCAQLYLDAILEQGDRPFDRAFMERTFDRFWAYAQYDMRLAQLMVESPPHVQEVIGAAQEHPEVADRYANIFDNPPRIEEWLLYPERTRAYLAEVAARS